MLKHAKTYMQPLSHTNAQCFFFLFNSDGLLEGYANLLADVVLSCLHEICVPVCVATVLQDT